jgi:hypothetical protein
VKSTVRVSEVGESDGCLGKAGAVLVVVGHVIFHLGVTPNKSLVQTAHAAFDCVECLLGVGLVGQVGVKSKLLLAAARCFRIVCIAFDCLLLRAAHNSTVGCLRRFFYRFIGF